METTKVGSSRRDRIAGVLIGTLVGVGAGILLAPASGKETRQRIKGQADKVANQVKATAIRLEDGAKGMLTAARDRHATRLGVDVDSALGRLDDELKATTV